jgi:hypothetical protein
VKRHLGTLLLVLASLVLGWLVFRDREGVSDVERGLRKGSVFPAWRKDRVSRIVLHTDSGEVLLDRDTSANMWSLHGSTERADSAKADVLLAELESARVLRPVDDAAKTSLDAPRVRGEVTMGDLSYRFVLGGDAKKPEGAAYFRVEGEPAVVVEKRLVGVLVVRPEEYREKSLVTLAEGDLSEVRIVPTGKPELRLVRDGKTRFLVGAAGKKTYASRTSAEIFASALAELRAEKFLSATEGAAALVSPTLELSLRGASGKENTFVFGGACPGSPLDVVVVRKDSTPLYACVPAGIVGTFARGESEYVDASAFFARVDEVEEVVVHREGGSVLDVARKGSGFVLRAPEARELDSDASDSVRAWIVAMLSARGEAGTVHEGEGKKLASVDLHYGEIVESAEVRALPDGRVYAARKDGLTLIFPAASAPLFSPPASVTRSSRLVPGANARMLEGYELRCGGLVQKIVKRDGYRFEEPAPFPLDGALAASAASMLLGARAEAWVADESSPAFPISSTCGAKVRFADDAGPREVAFELGESEQGPVYGRLVGDRAVFLAPRELAELVRRPLASREGFVIDAASALEMTVFRGLGSRKVGLDTDAGRGSLRDVLFALRPSFVLAKRPYGRADEGEDPLTVDVIVAGDAGVRTVRLRFGKEGSFPEGKLVYAGKDGVPFVFAVRSELVEPLRRMLDAGGGPRVP